MQIIKRLRRERDVKKQDIGFYLVILIAILFIGCQRDNTQLKQTSVPEMKNTKLITDEEKNERNKNIIKDNIKVTTSEVVENKKTTTTEKFQDSKTQVILKIGDKGVKVMELQKKLYSIGYDISVDGSFGRATVNTLLSFQEKHGLSATGNLDKLTQEKISNIKVLRNYEKSKVEVPAKPQESKPIEHEKVTNLSQLKSELEALCKGKGDWSIYIKDLKTGNNLSINNKQMVSASIIKLFIMTKIYDAIKEEELKQDNNIDNLLNKMITVSSNASSNKLVDLLGNGIHERGMEKVNNLAKEMDFLNTSQQRKFYDSGAPANLKENYTSVEDTGRFLEKIYNKQCVSKEFDVRMMKLMLAQQRNSKLPALLPKGVKVAHKTGELSNVENDVGIVFTSKTDYVICVMGNKLKNTKQGRELIAQISKKVYDYFQNQY